MQQQSLCFDANEAPAGEAGASLRFCVLGSGSTGNATFVQARTAAGEFGLLIDCGVALNSLQKRLQAFGCDLGDIDAVFITHEHSDHVGALPALVQSALASRQLQVLSSRGTWAALKRQAKRAAFAPILQADWREAASGVALALRPGLSLLPFAVPHDSAEPLQLSLALHTATGLRKMAYATDLGHDCPHVAKALQGAHAMLLESNHDLPLLMGGPYPPFLRRRVAGPHGHLSNQQSAALLQAAWHPGLHTVVAGHVSLQNNTPELAAEALRPAIHSPTQLICCPAQGWHNWIEV